MLAGVGLHPSPVAELLATDVYLSQLQPSRAANCHNVCSVVRRKPKIDLEREARQIASFIVMRLNDLPIPVVKD